LKSIWLPSPSVNWPSSKDLQQDVENIRMRLLDFVEQDDRIGRPLHALGKLPAFLVADVPGGEPISFETSASPELRHVEADEALLAAEQEKLASARATSVLPTPVGPRTGTILRTARCFEPRA